MPQHLIADTSTLTGRLLKHIFRSVDTIMTTAMMPVLIMLMFVFVFGGSIHTGTITYINYILPGILLITIASGISYTSFRLFQDMSSGMFERFRSMPIARASVLWSHVLTSLAANAIAITVVWVVGLICGFRSNAPITSWLAVFGIMMVVILALTWVALIPGLTANSTEGAIAYSYPLIFLPFLSSAFTPTTNMPGPVRWFAENQPTTSIINSMRNLLTKQAVGNNIWIALAWCAGILLVAYIVTMVVYKRKFT